MTARSSMAGTAPEGSAAFTLLHPHVQQRLWQWGWKTLHPAQERAIPLVLNGTSDVIVAAATASGKTEAAFLPIVSNLLQQPAEMAGTSVLYLAPMKALLNDQFERLTRLCDGSDVSVHVRHGDVPDRVKRRWLKDPSGILMTTPESLEALLARQGGSVARLFGDLRYVIVDELHAFLGAERGAQLQSLLGRLEEATGKQPVRIGLSATLGDLKLVARQLNPARPGRVQIVAGDDARPQVTVELVGVRETDRSASGLGRTAASPLHLICDELLERLGRGHHLVFANSRQGVEALTDRLKTLTHGAGMLDVFHPHHGSLAAQLRAQAEEALKETGVPATAIATTTLEMGIDVGAVQTVTQVGPAPGVANLRQRLGRSGRRGQPARLTTYCTEMQLSPRSSLDEQLRAGLVQSIAMIELLLRGWCEDPPRSQLHTSTLVQQLLSAVAERGGLAPRAAFDLLCNRPGPFKGTDWDRFKRLLIALVRAGVLERSDRVLWLGPEGEKIVGHHEFFAAFTSPREYRFVAKGSLIGTRPMVSPVRTGDLIVFGGLRWEIKAIDHQARRVDLAPNPAGRARSFGGDGSPVHDVVRRTMRSVLGSSAVPGYVDEEGRALLREARHVFGNLDLGHRALVPLGAKTQIVPWVGTRTSHTLGLLLQSLGVKASADGLSILCTAPHGAVLQALKALAAAGPANARDLAELVPPVRHNKHDRWLDDDLLRDDYAARELDVDATQAAVARILHEEGEVADPEGPIDSTPAG